MDMLKKKFMDMLLESKVIRDLQQSNLYIYSTIPIIDRFFCLTYHTKQMQNNSRHFVDVE